MNNENSVEELHGTFRDFNAKAKSFGEYLRCPTGNNDTFTDRRNEFVIEMYVLLSRIAQVQVDGIEVSERFAIENTITEIRQMFANILGACKLDEKEVADLAEKRKNAETVTWEL